MNIKNVIVTVYKCEGDMVVLTKENDLDPMALSSDNRHSIIFSLRLLFQLSFFFFVGLHTDVLRNVGIRFHYLNNCNDFFFQNLREMHQKMICSREFIFCVIDSRLNFYCNIGQVVRQKVPTSTCFIKKNKIKKKNVVAKI